MSEEVNQNKLYAAIVQLLQSARQAVVRSVNQTMVHTYYEIGRMIVEDEQQGKERAQYGKQVLKELSQKLIENFGKGFSVDNLQNMRQFYLSYSIYETTSRKLISSTDLAKLEDTKNQTLESKSSAELQQTEKQGTKISAIQLRKFSL